MPQRNRYALIVLPAIAALVLGGCVAGPRVTVENAVWSHATDEAAVLDFELHVRNTGQQPLELREMQYRVALAGRHVYTGRRATAMTLAPGAESRVTLPAVVRLTEAPQGVFDDGQTGRVTGSVVFVTPGRLALMLRDLGLPRPTSGFHGSATITSDPAAAQ